MRHHGSLLLGILGALSSAIAAWADDAAVSLPPGVQAAWDLEKADRDATPTRERICINGLWRWQPAEKNSEQPPQKNWGYFKVPGCWPGITDYMQKDSQTVFSHAAWKDERLAGTTAAWYQREILIPAEWSGRRIALSAEYLNSLATVYVDGQKVGELRFPGDELDLAAHVRPGGKQVLSLHVAALPLKEVLLSFSDTNTARQQQGSVARRGLCGDVFLVSTPPAARIADVKIDTSVRRGEIALEVALEKLAGDATYSLQATIGGNNEKIAQFTSPPVRTADLRAGRITFVEKWKPDQLWDIHTPQNTYEITLSLRDAAGKVLDICYPKRFG